MILNGKLIRQTVPTSQLQEMEQSREGMVTFCSALTRPHLEYYIQIWITTRKAGVQGKATTIIKIVLFTLQGEAEGPGLVESGGKMVSGKPKNQ